MAGENRATSYGLWLTGCASLRSRMSELPCAGLPVTATTVPPLERLRLPTRTEAGASQ